MAAAVKSAMVDRNGDAARMLPPAYGVAARLREMSAP